MWDLNLCVILLASFTPPSPFRVVVTGVRLIREGEEGFVRLTKSNFAPAMMHDARRITDADVDRVRQRTAISCLARFSRVDEAAFSFSLPLYILGRKPPPRNSVGFLFIPPFVRWTRTSSLRPQTESEGRSDGRKERSNYTEQSARINSHHSRTLISICGRPRGCQSIMDWGNISTQDLSSYLYFLRIHSILRQFQSKDRSGAVHFAVVSQAFRPTWLCGVTRDSGANPP